MRDEELADRLRDLESSTDRKLDPWQKAMAYLLSDASAAGADQIAASAAIELAFHHLGMSEHEAAGDFCVRGEQALAGLNAPVLQARSAWIRAYLTDGPPDRATLAILERSGLWAEASEASGARIRGPSLLCTLARREASGSLMRRVSR